MKQPIFAATISFCLGVVLSLPIAQGIADTLDFLADYRVIQTVQTTSLSGTYVKAVLTPTKTNIVEAHCYPGRVILQELAAPPHKGGLP